MTTYRLETVTAEGFTLSQLVWRLLGRQPAGYVEMVYELNYGLADLGAHIPVGTEIKFPVDDIPDETEAEEVVRLWD